MCILYCISLCQVFSWERKSQAYVSYVLIIIDIVSSIVENKIAMKIHEIDMIAERYTNSIKYYIKYNQYFYLCRA